MKALRIIYYILFAFSALISVNLIFNLLRGGGFNDVNTGPFIVALIIVIVQIVGFVMVILDRNRIAMGILSIFTGIATYFFGAFAVAVLGAPAPRVLGDISYASYIAGQIILVCCLVVGLLFIIMQYKNIKVLQIIYYILFAFSALILVNLICNLVCIGELTVKTLAAALIFAAVQICGIVFVVLDRNRIVSGMLTVLAGIATYFLGNTVDMMFGLTSALREISIISKIAGWFLLICYTVVGVMFIYQKFKKNKQTQVEKNLKTPEHYL